MNNNKNNIDMLGLIFLVFLVLKLCNVINWSWWWIAAPLWGPFIFMLFAVVPCMAVYFGWQSVSYTGETKKRKKYKPISKKAKQTIFGVLACAVLGIIAIFAG